MAALLDESGERVVWRLVGIIGDREPGIYNAFGESAISTT